MNNITSLFKIKYPIIQGGMIWCSGWELASAVCNAGGLGLIGAGSMYPDVLLEHIQKCKAATQKPFGVNVPLLYPQTDELMEIIIRKGVKIVFTSAGNPKKYTAYLKEKGITVDQGTLDDGERGDDFGSGHRHELLLQPGIGDGGLALFSTGKAPCQHRENLVVRLKRASDGD